MSTRPTLLGYLKIHILMTSDEVAAAQAQLAAFAEREGFTLKKVFVERPDTAPAAFHSMIEMIRRDHVRTVVVPTLRHLGTPAAMRDHLEHYTSVRVLVATKS